MKIINGKGAMLGRLASVVAKAALQGEEVVVLNCDEVIISGNKKTTQEAFREKRTKVGSAQKGPKHSRISYKIVKRAIRGMLPNHREGRGKEALKKITCYSNIPNAFADKETMHLEKKYSGKFLSVKELQK